MNQPTDWGSAVAILIAGLVLGGMVLVYLRSRRSAALIPADSDPELTELEASRDALIQQLRELDTEGNLTPDQAAAERKRLERETAGVLRSIDAHKRRAPKPDAVEVEPVAPVAPMNPALKGVLWGLVSFAAIGGLAWFVMESANPRGDGGSMTGGLPSEGASQQPDPVVMQLEASIARDPENMQLRNDLAQAYLERNDLMKVFEQTKIVLAKLPEDSRAMTYQALVRLSMGERDAAQQMLETATKKDPKNLDAWVSLAWSYVQANKMKEAEAAIASAVKASPADKAQLEQVFAEMRNHQASGAMQATSTSTELPSGHPPVDGAPMAGQQPAMQPQPGMQRPPAPADGKSVKLTLAVAPESKMKSGILFVMARTPAGGPPIAVKRLEVNAFPITFDFGSADSMMGQPLPDKFRLEARLDSDGNVMTKPPTDPSVVQNDAVPGSALNLTLK